MLLRHMVVCRATKENGAHADGVSIDRENKIAIFTHMQLWFKWHQIYNGGALDLEEAKFLI